MATKKKAVESVPVNTSEDAQPVEFDAMASLMDAVPASKPKSSKKGSDHPVVPIPEEMEDSFRSYVFSNVIDKEVSSVKTTSDAEVKEYFLKLWTEKLFQTKAPPESFVGMLYKDGKPDCSALFTVKAVFRGVKKVVPEERTKPAQEYWMSALVGNPGDPDGLDPDKAKALIKENLDFTPFFSIVPLSDLLIGKWSDGNLVASTPEEKKIGNRLVQIINSAGDENGQIHVAAFSNEEKARLLVRQEMVTLKEHKTFFARMPQYCRTVAELRRLFRVFAPDMSLSQVHMGLNDSVAKKGESLLNAAKEVLGIEE